MINLPEELALARHSLTETDTELALCEGREGEFYARYREYMRMNREFWAGQITYLEKLLQKKSITDMVTPLQV